MRKGLLLVGGLGLGAGLMYVFDPDKGRRRRAMMRDRTRHVLGESGVRLEKKTRDVLNRSQGLVARAGAALRCEAVPDKVLEDRVRSQMGRAVSEPRDIEVLASEGRIILRGVVPAGEADRLLRRLSGVRGVREVESQLNVRGRHPAGGARDDAGGNGSRRSPESLPGPARVVMTLVGGALTFYGMKRRGAVGSVAGVAGMRMLARGLGNTELHRSNVAGSAA